MGEALVLESRDDGRLRAFLERADHTTVYHTPEWRDAVINTYGYEAFYVGYEEGDALEALLPMMLVRSRLTGTRLVSLPFSNVCGPAGREDAFGALVEKALEVYAGTGAEALEIRTQANLGKLEDPRFRKSPCFITSILDLDPDPEKIFKGFRDNSIRSETRQAARKGVGVRMGENLDDLGHFYRLFVGNRLKHGVPPAPFEFFENLWNSLGPGMRRLFLATVEGRPVSAVLALAHKKTIGEAYLGADAAYLSYRVNQMVIWKGIEWACLNGYEKWDFLRTPRDNRGLRFFKAKWGGNEVDLDYLYYPEVKGSAGTIEESAKYRLMTTVLKRSPAFVGKALGRMFYRHLG